MQNDSPAFVTLLAYIGLFYAFLGDTFIFNEQLQVLEIVGVLLILCMNVWMVYDKLMEVRGLSTREKREHFRDQRSMMSSAF